MNWSEAAKVVALGLFYVGMLAVMYAAVVVAASLGDVL